MSLYPSLEDMQVDKLARAQNEVVASSQVSAPYPTLSTSMPMPPTSDNNGALVYPPLGEYMGLEFSQSMIAQNMPEYQVALSGNNSLAAGVNQNLVAPISGQSLGLQRAQVTNGIRELVLCKGQDNKIGLRVKPINNGIFVCLVVDKSPAALGGLRFGDQILQINGNNLAGYSMDKVHELLRKSPINGITMVVRDRPFERTLTLHKDSTGHVGFHFKNGKIISLVKDSSAARNGVLTDHQLLEVEGQNVVGLKDKEVTKLIDQAGNVVTVTVIPSFLYDHMIKKIHGSLLKDLMDHSIPSL